MSKHCFGFHAADDDDDIRSGDDDDDNSNQIVFVNNNKRISLKQLAPISYRRQQSISASTLLINFHSSLINIAQ